MSAGTTARPAQVRSDLLLLLTALIWGFVFVAQRVGPFFFNGVRFALGCLPLLPFVLRTAAAPLASRRRARRPSTSHLLILLLATPALAQDERPPLAVPEPERQRSTPTPGSTSTIVQVEYNDAVKDRDYLSSALEELVRFTRAETDLEVSLNWRNLTLHDRSIMDALMLYMTGCDGEMRITQPEKKNLAQYLQNGGLLFAEDILPLGANLRRSRGGAGIAGTAFDQQFKALLKDPQVLGSDGGRWRKLPKNDPLYSAYFDFSDGPPLSGIRQGNVLALEAIEIRGRTAVIFSDLNISWFWGNLNAEGRNRSLQFGTNLVVFALVQKHSGRPLPVRR